MAKHPLNQQGYQLSYGDQLALIASGGTSLLSAINTYTSGRLEQQSYNFQAWQNSMNAEITRRNAQDIIRVAQAQMAQVEVEGAKVRGEQRAAMSASGFDVESGSYQSIIDETDRNIQRNIAAIRSEAMQNYGNTMFQADMYDIQSQYLRKAGKIARKQATGQALASGLTGALQLAGAYYFGGSGAPSADAPELSSGGNIKIGGYY